jgi:MYXO-CTERM domain-containing protein
MRSRWSWIVVALGAAAFGCGEKGTTGTTDTRGSARSSIVGGTPSTSAQDGTVLLINGNESCSGSLIAPNLILTARHCVADPQQGDTDCVGYGPTIDASQMQVFVGKDLDVAQVDTSNPDATGTRITVPQTENMCSFDVALIELDSDLTKAGALLVPLRFTDLAPNESTVAVGYGVGGNDEDRPVRMQRTTSVIAVGPQSIQFKSQNGTIIPYDLPKGDVATGESTCFGDSGGPLLDAKGNLVAVTSRGTQTPDDGTHGNGCIDSPSIYAGVKQNESTIRAAAKAAGHELPASAPAPASKTGDPAAPAAGDDDDDKTAKGPASSSTSTKGDDDDDGTTTTKPKKRSGTTPAPAAKGCSASPSSSSSSGSSALVLGLAVALSTLRRRRRGSVRSQVG